MAALPAGEPWSSVLVIPACNETPKLLRPPPPCPGRSLLILVINESASAPAHVSAANRILATAVRDGFEPIEDQDVVSSETASPPRLFRDPKARRDVLVVDRFSPGRTMPEKGGVGMARKVGCDLALALFQKGQILSPWLHCSDGDVVLPETYFECANTGLIDDSRVAALVYPFEHVVTPATESDVALAMHLYELSLRYYVAGMRFAGSPYAFHTIGSTMAVNARHYAQVRGFPRRDAGEDFYLLNKLAKVGEIHELAGGKDCRPIEIQARRSDRVPFGTGAAVNAITGLVDPVKDFRYYHPAVFPLLKTWLKSWPAIWASRSTHIDGLAAQAEPPPAEWNTWRDDLVRSLQDIGAEKALAHAFRQSSDLAQFTRQMHTWFDAFKTLKLIHSLRNNRFSSIDYRSLVAHPDFLRYLDCDPELRAFFQSISNRIRI